MTDDPNPRTTRTRTGIDGHDLDALTARLAAVERALTDGETHLDGLQNAAALAARVDELESAVEAVDDRLTAVEAAAQALRGYVGGVRAVNESVERRADAALAAVESLEETVRNDPSAAAFGPTTDSAAAVADETGARERGGADASRVDGADATGAGGGDATADTHGTDEARAADAPQGETLAARVRRS